MAWHLNSVFHEHVAPSSPSLTFSSFQMSRGGVNFSFPSEKQRPLQQPPWPLQQHVDVQDSLSFLPLAPQANEERLGTNFSRHRSKCCARGWGALDDLAREQPRAFPCSGAFHRCRLVHWAQERLGRRHSQQMAWYLHHLPLSRSFCYLSWRRQQLT